MDYPGSKTRKMFVKGVAVDNVSMEYVYAISRKLERDYLPLFKSLSDQYKIGKIKKSIDRGVDLIRGTILIIDSIIRYNSISDDDSKKLISNISEIDSIKDYLVYSSNSTISFRNKLKKVQDNIGVSIKDLNITKSVVKKSVEKAKGGISTSKFLSKKVSRYASDKSFDISKSITSGILGPFAFAVEDIFKGIKDVFEYSRISREGRRNEKLLSSLKERSVDPNLLSKSDILGKAMDQSKARIGVSTVPDYERTNVFPYFRIKPKSSGISGTSFDPTEAKGNVFSKASEFGYAHEKLTVVGLFKFFDKGAYKAKWTSELLKAIKGERSGGEFGSNLYGLLGKAGQLAALAAAIGLTIDQLIKLKNAFGNLEKSKQLEDKAADQLIAATKQKIDKIKEVGGIETYGKKVGKTPRQIAIDIESYKQQALLNKVHARPWWIRSIENLPFMRLIGVKDRLNPLKRQKPFYERVSATEEGLSKKQLIDVQAKQAVEDVMKSKADFESGLNSRKPGIAPIRRRDEELNKGISRTVDLSKIRLREDHTKEIATEVKKLNKNFEEWQKKSGIGRSSIDAGRIRDSNDSGDSLLRELNGANGLSVGD